MSSAVLIVIAAWLVAFCAITGLGHFVRNRFGLTTAEPDAWPDAFWLGYTVVIAVLQLWHLAFAIDWRVCALLAAIGGFGFLGAVWQARTRFRVNVRILITVLALLPIALWVAARSLDTAFDFDSGFYHFSAIRWLNTYPVVPGIGNLHYRLAFNQTFFLFVAALNISPFFNQGYHIANSLLVIVLAGQLLGSTFYALRYPRRFSPYRLLGALFLPVILYRVTSQPYSANISSPSPDLSIFVFQAVVALAFVRFLIHPTPSSRSVEGLFGHATPPLLEMERGPEGGVNDPCSVFFITALSAIGITSKLSFAGFGAAVVIVTFGVWLLRQHEQLGRVLRLSLIHLLIVAGLIGLPWIVHGLITSGYPAFPSSFGGLPVDYRIPRAITREAELWVYSFARQPNGDMDTVLSNWDWIPGWWERVQRDPFDVFLFRLPMEIGVGALVLTLAWWLLKLIRRKFMQRDLLLLLPLVPALIAGVFWFLSAPDPRFAGAAFWIFGLSSVVLLVFSLTKTRPRLISIPALIVPAICAGYMLVTEFNHGANFASAQFRELPTAPVRPYVTDSGLTVYISGDPNNTLQLWDAPLPATPYRLPSLQLRWTDLRDGFRLAPDAVLTPP